MKIVVTFNVDEDKVKEESGADNVNDAISQELGWVEESGLYVDYWETVPEDNK